MQGFELGKVSIEVLNIVKEGIASYHANYSAQIAIYVDSSCLHTIDFDTTIDLKDHPFDHSHKRLIKERAEEVLSSKIVNLLALVRGPRGD